MTRNLFSSVEATAPFLRLLGSPVVRLSLVTLFFVLSVYLGYHNAYAPRWGEVELPSSVDVRTPRIDMKNLDIVTVAAKERIEYTPHTFDIYRSIFSNESE